MADIYLKVKSEELKSIAGDISDVVAKIQRQYEILKNTSDATKGYWEGAAADVFRKYVKSIDKDMNDVLKRLKEHPTDLLKMAGLYNENESSVQELISTLPTDVIS